MKDLLLGDSGDLLLDETGDIQITDSIKQAIEIRLKWFANEWKLGPEFGIPYYEEVFVKNPSELLIEEKMRDAIMSVDEVKDIVSFDMSFDIRLRKLTVTYVVSVGENLVEGSVRINA